MNKKLTENFLNNHKKNSLASVDDKIEENPAPEISIGCISPEITKTKKSGVGKTLKNLYKPFTSDSLELLHDYYNLGIYSLFRSDEQLLEDL